MKTIIDYLDDLKGKTGSDYASAKALNTNRSTLSCIRSRGQCGDDTALKIADLLGIEREEVVIAAAIARSNGEARTVWEKISRVAGIAAGFILPFQALSLFFGLKMSALCILCQIGSNSKENHFYMV